MTIKDHEGGREGGKEEVATKFSIILLCASTAG